MRLDWWGAYQDAIALAEKEAGRTLKASEVSDYWYGRSFAWWRESPLDALSLMFQKTAFFFGGIELSNNRNIDLFYREYAPYGRPALYLAYVLMPLALVGAVSAWRRGGWPARAAILLGASYAVSVILFFVTARYRVPVRPLLAILAIEGGRAVVAGIRSGRPRGWLPLGAAIALGIGLNVNPWTRAYTPSPAQFYQSVANVLRDTSDLGEAVAAQEKALSIDPTYPKGNLNLGTMYMTQGRVPEAILAFRRELALDPTDGRAHASLARALDRSGQIAAAEKAYAAAEAAGLEDAPALYNHALLLERLERPEEAADLYRRSVAADSTFVEAWNNLGVYHARAGRLEEAVALWERVLALEPGHPRASDNLRRARARMTNPPGEEAPSPESGG
jgi:Tfp pilus assembly protein PilF